MYIYSGGFPRLAYLLQISQKLDRITHYKTLVHLFSCRFKQVDLITALLIIIHSVQPFHILSIAQMSPPYSPCLSSNLCFSHILTAKLGKVVRINIHILKLFRSVQRCSGVHVAISPTAVCHVLWPEQFHVEFMMKQKTSFKRDLYVLFLTVITTKNPVIS